LLVRASEPLEHCLHVGYRISSIRYRPREAFRQRRRVVGRRRHAEPYVRDILLLVRSQEPGQPRCSTHEDDEEAGRQRIEGPGMADLRSLQRAPHHGDDVVRCGARGLVYQ